MVIMIYQSCFSYFISLVNLLNLTGRLVNSKYKRQSIEPECMDAQNFPNGCSIGARRDDRSELFPILEVCSDFLKDTKKYLFYQM